MTEWEGAGGNLWGAQNIPDPHLGSSYTQRAALGLMCCVCVLHLSKLYQRQRSSKSPNGQESRTRAGPPSISKDFGAWRAGAS